jgi:penicillin-binding protein 1A
MPPVPEAARSKSVAGEAGLHAVEPAEGGPRGRGPLWQRRSVRWLAWIGMALGGCALAACLFVWLTIAHYSDGLPSVERLKSGYDPPQVSRIFAADGTVLSSVFTERRTVVPFSEISDATKLAFLAAEDAHFYEHEGLNYLGVLRAMWANLRAGHTVQGGSTITQQVVKNVLLDRERTYRRKVRETILSRRLEQYLSKNEIFALYLNHIYLGHGRYGIEEAARYYFGKRAIELDAGEAALLAGLVASPERYSPRRVPERALARRQYVLEQMRAKGFVTEAYFQELSHAPPPRLAPEVDTQSGLCPEVVDAAKEALLLVQKDEHRSQGGYSVTTTIQPELQLAARRAVRKALSDYADRHSLWPPYTSKDIKAWGKPFQGKPNAHRVYVGVVKASDDQAGRLEVQVGDVTGQLTLADEERYNPKHLPPSQFAEPGAVLRVRLAEAPDGDHPPRLRLELGPQAALVALDVRSRDVVALVGSYEALPGTLDRALYAHRQPGSSFKPLVYSYALHTRQITPGSVLDLERLGPGVVGGPPYRVSVRNALAQSNNEAAVQLLRTVGPKQVVDWAQQLGIESKLGADLSLALGSYELTPIELCNAFATFASGGYIEPPRLLAELRAPNGEVIPLPPRAPRRRVMDAEEAYLTTSLLESVVQLGTGRLALSIGHPIAGKTGTTNDVKDAWFVGYSTDLAVAVWVGFDDALPLGTRESGSHTALPAFVDFMTAAHAGRPVTEFPRPPSIIVASIDPATGLLPRPGQANALAEEFLDGTVPEGTAPEPIPIPDRAEEMPYKPDPGD